jgi:hypothetical protein
VGMGSELSNSLEAIANLLYLIRKSHKNPAAVSAYVGLAEDRIRAIAIQYGRVAPEKASWAACPTGLRLKAFIPPSHLESSRQGRVTPRVARLVEGQEPQSH